MTDGDHELPLFDLRAFVVIGLAACGLFSAVVTFMFWMLIL